MKHRSLYRDQPVGFLNAGVDSVVGGNAVMQHLALSLIVGKCYAIAMGKAASSMLHGALKSLPEQIVRSLLITRQGHVDPLLHTYTPSLEIVQSSHPVPRKDSLYAGQRLLAFIAATPANAHLLVLISGGTSSLVEVLPRGAAPGGHWQSATFIAGWRIDGITAPWVVNGSMNGEAFKTYLRSQWVTTLRSNDIVVGDNLCSHKVAGVQEIVIVVIWLSLYPQCLSVKNYPIFGPSLPLFSEAPLAAAMRSRHSLISCSRADRLVC